MTVTGINSIVQVIFRMLFQWHIRMGHVCCAAGQQEYWDVFQDAYRAVMQHYRSGAWYDDADIGNGRSLHQQFQSLQAFWPGPPEPHAVLCCAVLCCAVLCCALLCCAVLCCAVLCCAVLCCAVLCCAVLGCAVLPCAESCCAVLPCVWTNHALLSCAAKGLGVCCHKTTFHIHWEPLVSPKLLQT